MSLAEQLLDLASPKRPSHRLPLPVRRILPKPLESLEDWQRFTGQDLAGLRPADRLLESIRIRGALAGLEDPEDVPPWLLMRLELLEVAG